MSTDDALAGAGDIIAETISDDAAIRAALRRLYRTRGVLWAKAATDEDSVYRLYYDYREPVSRVQGHRVLAVNRGEREGMLKAGVEIEDALALQEIRRAVFRGISISNAFVNACCEDAWRRLIEPSAEREIRGELTDAADEAAIRAFGQNLQPLLMQPPLRNRVTMGFDPAYRTGCKIAVVDDGQGAGNRRCVPHAAAQPEGRGAQNSHRHDPPPRRYRHRHRQRNGVQ